MATSSTDPPDDTTVTKTPTDVVLDNVREPRDTVSSPPLHPNVVRARDTEAVPPLVVSKSSTAFDDDAEVSQETVVPAFDDPRHEVLRRELEASGELSFRDITAKLHPSAAARLLANAKAASRDDDKPRPRESDSDVQQTVLSDLVSVQESPFDDTNSDISQPTILKLGEDSTLERATGIDESIATGVDGVDGVAGVDDVAGIAGDTGDDCVDEGLAEPTFLRADRGGGGGNAGVDVEASIVHGGAPDDEQTRPRLLRAATGADSVPPLPANTPVGEYVIEQKIGAGAMGAVYRAIHPTIGKRVAVKVMSSRLGSDPAAIERFTREARTVAAIRHPGIVDVFGFGTLDDGRAYLIMEWLDGTSLGSRLERGPLPLDESLEILDQIARALAAAHEQGVTHRDLKPDNIFLQSVRGEPSVVKIVDFGLAKLARDERDHAMTQSGVLLGTPLYMSPEQCRGKGVDHRTDTYALGCIAYELLCGRVPFVADNIAELIAAHLGEPPPQPRMLSPSIPIQLDGLLVAMVDKDPARRPSLKTIRQTLAKARGLPIGTPVPGTLTAGMLAAHAPARPFMPAPSLADTAFQPIERRSPWASLLEWPYAKFVAGAVVVVSILAVVAVVVGGR